MQLFNRTRFVLAAAFVCLFSLAAQADQITLKDGDRISGEIVKKDGETVSMKSKNFGDVTFKWEEIDTIVIDKAVTVALTGGQSVKGTVRTQNGNLEILTPSGPQNIPPGDVLALRNDAEQSAHERMLNPGMFDLWTVSGSLNLAGSKGNAETSTLTTPINLIRVSNTSRTTAYFNSIRGTATVDGIEDETARAVRGGWAFSRNLSKRIFLNVFNDYEYDAFQSLDLRVVLGGGAGYEIWNDPRKRLALVAGFAWNREKFDPIDEEPFTRNSGEVYWGNDFDFKMSTRTSIVQSFRMFNNISEGGEYRINGDIGIVTQITKWLNWNVSLSDRFLSNPVEGRQKNDLLYTTGLGFTFSR